MPTETDQAFVKLADAVMASVSESKAVREDLIRTIHTIDKNVAVLTANSESEKDHRMSLEKEVNGLRQEVAKAVKTSAEKNVKVGLMWSGMTSAVGLGLLFVWNAITGKGG
jgi:prefoldin subunit 5